MLSQRKIGTLLSYISVFLGTAISFIYTPFMLGRLGQEEYSLFSLVNSIMAYLTIFDFGFNNTIVRYTAQHRNDKNPLEREKLYGMFMVLYGIIGIIALIAGGALTVNVEMFSKTLTTAAQISKARVLMIIATVNIALSFPLGLYNAVISGYEKYTLMNLLELVRTVITPLTMTGILMLNFGSVGMLAATAVISVGLNLVRLCYCVRRLNVKFKFKGFDKKLFKEIITYSVYIFIAVIVDKIFWNTDQIILAMVGDKINEVGIYNLSNTFTSVFISVTSILGSMYLPQFTRMVTEKVSDKNISDQFIRVSRLQFFMCMFIWGGFLLVGKQFILEWAGAEYIKTYYVTFIIMSCLVAGITQNVGIVVLQAKNMHRFRALVQLIIALLNIGLTIIMARRWGAVGAAAATFITRFFGIFVILSIYYYKKAKLDVIKLWRGLVPAIVSNAVLIAVMWFVNRWTASFMPGILNIILIGGVYAALYVIITYFFNMNGSEKKEVRNIITLKS